MIFFGDVPRCSSRLKFVCAINDYTIEEIFTYNKLLDHINNSQEDDLIKWKFKEIIAHEGPLPRTHPNRNELTYNLTIEWGNGDVTNDTLIITSADDLESCTTHGRDYNLLDEHGWKRFKHLAKR